MKEKHFSCLGQTRRFALSTTRTLFLIHAFPGRSALSTTINVLVVDSHCVSTTSTLIAEGEIETVVLSRTGRSALCNTRGASSCCVLHRALRPVCDKTTVSIYPSSLLREQHTVRDKPIVCGSRLLRIKYQSLHLVSTWFPAHANAFRAKGYQIVTRSILDLETGARVWCSDHQRRFFPIRRHRPGQTIALTPFPFSQPCQSPC